MCRESLTREQEGKTRFWSVVVGQLAGNGGVPQQPPAPGVVEYEPECSFQGAATPHRSALTNANAKIKSCLKLYIFCMSPILRLWSGGGL